MKNHIVRSKGAKEGLLFWKGAKEGLLFWKGAKALLHPENCILESSTTHSRQAKLRATGLNPFDIASIHFHEFPTPHFLSPPPNPDASTEFPAHLQPSFDASQHMREPVYALLCKVADTAQRVIVIYDPLAAFVIQDAALIPNAESYVFNCLSAFTQFFNIWEGMGKPFEVENEPKKLPSMEGCITFEIINFAVSQHDLLKSRAGDIYNSSRLVEGSYLDLLAKEVKWEKEAMGNRAG
ncbi:hypothetical protein LguiB_005775 [Lonicera macranthoides]